MAVIPKPSQLRDPRTEAAVAFFGTWMITGLFLDGWAHNTSKPETFFSPWHGILYSGFAAAVAWFAWDGRRQARAGAPPASPGDAGLTIGLVLFVTGAIGDGFWHQIFGIEVNLEALLSPTHLLLLIGGFLMVTFPVRMAWRDQSVQAPSFRELLPQIVTLTLATALVLFFTQYLNAFRGIGAVRDVGHAKELREIEGLASLLATNLGLMYAVAFTLRRLRPPAGTFTLLFTAVAVALSGLHGFDRVELTVAALLAGVAADVLVAKRASTHLVLGVVPVVLWASYFAIAETSYGVVWTPELWLGSIVVASMSALLLGTLAKGIPTREVA